MTTATQLMSSEKKGRIRTAAQEKGLLSHNVERVARCADLSYFLRHFWPEVSNDQFFTNWHIDFLCEELMAMAFQVGQNLPKKHDLIINIPPGTTKSITCSIMFPVWCWTIWPWMRFIVTSYSNALSLEHAEVSRDLVRSERFRRLYPGVDIKRDKDTKSNFMIVYKNDKGKEVRGGNRYSTSVGGTLTGFHGHFLITDDPLDPNRAASDTELKKACRWVDTTLSTRKTNKLVSASILIMQRLHQGDPTGHILEKEKENLRHICLPGEIREYKDYLKPKGLAKFYKDGLLDPRRMPWKVMKELKEDLGQYAYAGQIGQNPTPPGGGMFRTEMFLYVDALPAPDSLVECIRYWDKAGTAGGGAYTVGAKMYKLKNGTFLITDIVRGQWSSEKRERIIRATAEADGTSVKIFHEQEPGSGGKDSAAATTRNLAGYVVKADLPTGDKVTRADPFSVQVNNGNVLLLRADWNKEFLSEHAYFPFGVHKDQVDACAAAFNKLAAKRQVRSLTRRRKRR